MRSAPITLHWCGPGIDAAVLVNAARCQQKPVRFYAGNRTTLCRAAVLAKSTNRTTNKKQSDHAGHHYLVNTSYTRFWCRFLKSSYIRRYIVAALALANGHFHWIKAPSTQGFSILR
jgi:hypothetical protein